MLNVEARPTETVPECRAEVSDSDRAIAALLIYSVCAALGGRRSRFTDNGRAVWERVAGRAGRSRVPET